MNEGPPRAEESAAPAGGTWVDWLFSQLQTAVITGALAAGSKLSEPELARRYGVSRAPLREALNRLEARRLIERVPYAGARVVSLSREQLLEIYSVREALEGMACRLASERMTDVEIADLRALLSEHEASVERQGWRAYYQAEGDWDFHYRIIRASGNQQLMRILGEEQYDLIRMYRYQLSASTARPVKAFQEHHWIIEAIEERDGGLAEWLMRRHVARARANIRAHWQELG